MIPKFRAWNKQTGTIQEIESISFKEKKLVIEQQSIAWFNADYIRNFDDIELMQSTGLKDKNGVEIFEGDILHRRVHVILSGTNLNEWVDEYIHVEWKYGGWHVGEDLLQFVIEEGIDRHTFFRQTAVEVVGNIYENSELLEVTKC
ncbi:hypothetical protein FAE01_RS07010 [Enterococcus hirae]|uniref:YopX family protein n=1 Tax=Enterococcus faecium TaxID=1352 RepID=UPI0019E83AF7|nr:YopX family protein [Enterococcus faecium]MCL4608379.1 YopX family protein [Enterococcus faecium]MCL4613585.1 YopX family protein [Enterococcus faecium]